MSNVANHPARLEMLRKLAAANGISTTEEQLTELVRAQETKVLVASVLTSPIPSSKKEGALLIGAAVAGFVASSAVTTALAVAGTTAVACGAYKSRREIKELWRRAWDHKAKKESIENNE